MQAVRGACPPFVDNKKVNWTQGLAWTRALFWDSFRRGHVDLPSDLGSFQGMRKDSRRDRTLFIFQHQPIGTQTSDPDSAWPLQPFHFRKACLFSVESANVKWALANRPLKTDVPPEKEKKERGETHRLEPRVYNWVDCCQQPRIHFRNQLNFYKLCRSLRSYRPLQLFAARQSRCCVLNLLVHAPRL